MTERELNQYIALKQRLERNEKRLVELSEKEISVVCGKVKGSSKHHPYIETYTSVQMHEPKEWDRCALQIKGLRKSIEEDRLEIKRIEDYINSITDPSLQVVFELRVYEKMGWIDIAVELGEDKDRTTYSKKFKNYIQNSHNSPISQNSIV